MAGPPTILRVPTTLLTGGAGLVGSHVARLLVERGDDVRVTVRPSTRLANLEGLELATAQADVLDRAAMRRALRGVDRVFHVAGLANLRATPQALWKANVEGTRVVLEEALRAGVERVVLPSRGPRAGGWFSPRRGRPRGLPRGARRRTSGSRSRREPTRSPTCAPSARPR